MTFDPQDYWKKRFSNRLDLSVTGSIGMGTAYNDWLYRTFASALNVLLRKSQIRLDENMSVLDAGAGAGFLEGFCKNRGVKNLTGIDFVPASVSQLKERFPDYTFFSGDLTKPLDPLIEPADLTFCISVLYHVLSPEGLEQAIQNLKNATKPGGFIIIADDFLPKPYPYEGGHQRHWSKPEFEEIFGKHKITPLRYQPIFFTLNVPMRLCSSKMWGWYLTLWSKFRQKVSGSDRRANLICPFLYTVDALLQELSPTGPGSHYLLCQREK